MIADPDASLSPERSAQQFWLKPASAVEYARHAGYFHPFELVANEASTPWVVVATVDRPRSEGHCYDNLYSLHSYRLYLRLAKAALVPLTNKRITASWHDGTRLALNAGVVLRKSGRGYHATVDGLQTWIDLLPIDVGHRYVPQAQWKPAPGQRTLDPSMIRENVLRYGGTYAALVGPLLGTLGANPVDRAPDLVDVTTPCVRLRARVSVPLGELTSPERGGLGVGTSGGDAPYTVVAQGATIYWPGGQVAGAVIRETVVGSEIRPASSDATPTRRCFRPHAQGRIGLDGRPSARPLLADLALCFDRDALVEKTAPAAGRPQLDPPKR